MTRSGIPHLVKRASGVFAAETRGIISCKRHFETRIQAGPLSHSEQSDSAFIMRDGEYADIKYYRIVQDGSDWPPSKIASRDADTNRKWGSGQVFFKEPYVPRYLRDYSYIVQSDCQQCPGGATAVKFTSKVRDGQHGDGTMLIDGSSAHVLSLTYVPNVLPEHAKSGSVTETGGRVLPKLWYVTRIEEEFGGRAFLISGTATFKGRLDHFRRFATLDQAEAALNAKSL